VTYTNQNGDPIVEDVLHRYVDQPTPGEMWQITAMLLDHLKLEAVRTNATKSGQFEIALRPTDQGDAG
jgi:hypothetical protein